MPVTPQEVDELLNNFVDPSKMKLIIDTIDRRLSSREWVKEWVKEMVSVADTNPHFIFEYPSCRWEDMTQGEINYILDAYKAWGQVTVGPTSPDRFPTLGIGTAITLFFHEQIPVDNQLIAVVEFEYPQRTD